MNQMKFHQISLIGAGTALEIYDSYIFGFLLAQITTSFFPLNLQTDLIGIASFSVLFIVRPFGGLFWGIMGDRKGKILVFKHAILFMALATLCIGLVPTYKSIGWLAPIILLLLRAIQGFSISGELGSSVVMCYEQNNPKYRFRQNGLLYVFIFGGILLANLMIYIINKSHIDPAVSWRIPFIFGGISGIIIYIIRQRLKLQEIKHKEVNSKLVIHNYKILLLTISAIFLINLNWLYFSSISLILGNHFDNTFIHLLGLICSIIIILSSLISGYVFSLIPPNLVKNILVLALILMYTFFVFNSFYSNLAIEIFYIIEAILSGMIFSSLPIFIIDKLPNNMHNSIYNFANNISTTIIVGFMPFLINFLHISFGNTWLHTFFIINFIISIISLISVKLINNKYILEKA